MRAAAEARASLCDLLRVTRAVWRPVEENGTHWCAGTSPEYMLRWTLSELAEVEEEVAGLRRIPASDAAASEAALARVQDELYVSLLEQKRLAREHAAEVDASSREGKFASYGALSGAQLGEVRARARALL